MSFDAEVNVLGEGGLNGLHEEARRQILALTRGRNIVFSGASRSGPDHVENYQA